MVYDAEPPLEQRTLGLYFVLFGVYTVALAP